MYDIGLRAIAGKPEIILKEAKAYLTTRIEVIGEALAKGKKVLLAGFGDSGVCYLPWHQVGNLGHTLL